MFIKIKASNVGAIKNTIELDFLANSRNMKDNKFICETFDGLFINKLIGICGANASGKSTFVSILYSIGNFLFQAENRNLYLKNLAQMKLHNRLSANSFNELLLDIDSLEIVEANADKKKEPSYIYIELFINSDESTKGYYFYELEYNSSLIEKKGVNYERLYFKDKYESTKKTLLIDIKKNKESQIGYLIQYFENTKEIIKDEELNQKMPYIRAFYDYYIHRSLVFTETPDWKMDLISFYEKNLKFLNQVINIIDPNIKEAILDLNKERKSIVFLTKHDSKLRFSQLSDGTKRLLTFLGQAYYKFLNGGICVVDEIENGLHLSLVKFILLLTTINNTDQLIFTTHNPDIFEFSDFDEENRIFKMDQVYYILKSNEDTSFIKLCDINHEEFKNRTDVKFNNVYKNKKIIFQPDDKQLYNCLTSLLSTKKTKGGE